MSIALLKIQYDRLTGVDILNYFEVVKYNGLEYVPKYDCKFTIMVQKI